MNIVEQVKGLRISDKTTVAQLLSQMRHAGFQATELGRAAEVIGEMQKNDAKIFLAFTSNMTSSGLRELFAELCRRKKVSAVVTGIGSVEEDIIKIKKPFLLGSFNENDSALHEKGVNRIGNILVPNDRYEMLEKIAQEFYSEIFDKYKERRENGKYRAVIAGTEMVRELGLFMGKKFAKDKSALEDSWVYWCAKNDIPVSVPAPTDGALGLQLLMFRQDRDLVIDSGADLLKFRNFTHYAKKTGAIILGGGFAKHHTIGMNILRGGLDYAVYISTGTVLDGSMTGARTNEAVSWGKVNEKARTAYVEGDATVLFPLLMARLLD